VLEGGDGFFQLGRRWKSVGEFTDRVFEVAWFWQLDPAAVLRLPLDRFFLYERQAVRLTERNKN
jgi:hypothetical protein